MPNVPRTATARSLFVIGLMLVASTIAGSAQDSPSAAPTAETPTEAALALLFARDAATAWRHLPLAFKTEVESLSEPQRQQILGGLLFVRGIEAAGGKVERREREGKPEIVFTLPGGRGTIRVSLDKEVVEGARATLEGRVQRSGAPEEPLRARMIREEGTWRLAGVQGSTDPDPNSPAAIWANMDDPRIMERMAAAQRRANESLAIGDIRTLISAELTYAGTSGGFFGSPKCLVAPATCVPGYTGPAMMTPPYPWTSPRGGYTRTFHPGPMMLDLKREHAEASEGTLKSFAIVAVPVVPGKTGNRGFCGDSTARICTTSDGSAPPVQDGLCPAGCMELK
jgi:hypothetical protein